MSLITLICYVIVAMFVLSVVVATIVFVRMNKTLKDFNSEYNAAEEHIELTTKHMRNRPWKIPR
ncbi:hypothetical protein [Paenibacillus sinopodophylli]|uniref:hypothetical protein n=1 Tax=Paenibacillus sinopodophylli TaxID=1837342 RepID=UPI00110CF544|nr:hypothetical protein [Paenibacillus sinopodophylli]